LLASTLPARGAFSGHAFNIGIAGGFSTTTARRCLQEADLVIAVGCSLAQHNSDSGKLFDASNVLHIDVAPRSLSQGRAAAQYHLRSDARLGVESLLARFDAGKSDDTDWRSDALAQEIANAPADDKHYNLEPGMLDPRKVVAKLDQPFENLALSEMELPSPLV